MLFLWWCTGISTCQTSLWIPYEQNVNHSLFCQLTLVVMILVRGVFLLFLFAVPQAVHTPVKNCNLFIVTYKTYQSYFQNDFVNASTSYISPAPSVLMHRYINQHWTSNCTYSQPPPHTMHKQCIFRHTEGDPTLHAHLRSRSLLLTRNSDVMSRGCFTSAASLYCLFSRTILSFCAIIWK